MTILGAVRRAFGGGPAGERVRAHGEWGSFDSIADPYIQSFLRGGGATGSGAVVTVETAMRNMAVFRSVLLISQAVGMLPLFLYETGPEKRKATGHPLYRVLHKRPNGWQRAFDFRSLMQGWVLMHGDAYALIVRRGRDVMQLIPMNPTRVTVKQRDDFSVVYDYRNPSGGTRVLDQRDVFHLRGFSMDGLNGVSTVRQAAEAIGLALSAERAAARLFKHGMMVGGALKMPEGKKLSPGAADRLREDMASRFEGSENAERWMVLEEGLEAKPLAASAKDTQHLEMRRHQIEEVARAFGVPRPFLMLDDTSWGTGIDVLGQAFVRYGLNPWFRAWEEAVAASLLRPDEEDRYEAKFNAGALLRGNMKDQAEFFARALGAGGSAPWMHQDEVRDLMELGPRDDLPSAPGSANEGTNR